VCSVLCVKNTYTCLGFIGKPLHKWEPSRIKEISFVIECLCIGMDGGVTVNGQGFDWRLWQSGWPLTTGVCGALTWCVAESYRVYALSSYTRGDLRSSTKRRWVNNFFERYDICRIMRSDSGRSLNRGLSWVKWLCSSTINTFSLLKLAHVVLKWFSVCSVFSLWVNVH